MCAKYQYTYANIHAIKKKTDVYTCICAKTTLLGSSVPSLTLFCTRNTYMYISAFVLKTNITLTLTLMYLKPYIHMPTSTCVLCNQKNTHMYIPAFVLKKQYTYANIHMCIGLCSMDYSHLGYLNFASLTTRDKLPAASAFILRMLA